MTIPNEINYQEALERRWRIGQIADLFGISVQTLHHYDRIGLLVPYDRDSYTGYRYYLQSQIYRLANIIYLRKQGYSLLEIKNYFLTISFDGKAANLQSQAEQLDQEIERLRCISKAIREKIRYIEGSDFKEKQHIIETKFIPERKYLEIGPEKDLYSSETFYFFPTVIVYRPDKKIFGACISDELDFSSYTSLFPDFGDLKKQLKTFPSGHAVRCFHTGPYETIGQRIVDAINYAYTNRIKIKNYSIHYNIIDQFVEGDTNKYITEVLIPIIE